MLRPVCLHPSGCPASAGNVDEYEEQKACQRTHGGTQRAAACPVGCGCGGGAQDLVHLGSHFHKDHGGADADNGVDHLLRQLAHCRGHHGLLPLEIPAEHAHDGQDQKRRCQDPQGKGALRCVQHLVCEKSRTKKGDHRGGDTGHQGKYHGAVEHSLGIAVFPSGISRRHLLGHGQWNAVGGHQQHDGVNVKGTGIEAVALVADDTRHRDPVQHADDTHENGSNRKDASLF